MCLQIWFPFRLQDVLKMNKSKSKKTIFLLTLECSEQNSQEIINITNLNMLRCSRVVIGSEPNSSGLVYLHILVEIHPPLLWGTVDHHVKSKIEEFINQVPSRSFARALKNIVDTDQDPFFYILENSNRMLFETKKKISTPLYS